MSHYCCAVTGELELELLAEYCEYLHEKLMRKKEL
jgi:hypothetical protein